MIKLWVCAAAFAGVVAGGASGAPPVDMGAVVTRFASDRDALERFYDAPWSETREARLERFGEEAAAALEAIPFEQLDAPGRVDATLLRVRIAADRSDLMLTRGRRTELEPVIPFRRAILDLEEARWRLAPQDPRAAGAALADIASGAAAVRARVEAALAPEPGADAIALTPVLARRGAAAVGALQGTLQRWYEHSSEYDPAFSWWAQRPFEEASGALRALEACLREKVARITGAPDDPLIGDPIGRDSLLADLVSECIAYTPEELIAIGEREMAWCEARLREAASEMGLGEDWRAALARVRAAHVPPGEQDELVADLSREAIEFVRARDLLTIPPLAEELWRVRMLTAEGQRTLPFAAYSDLHFLVAFPTRSMSHADKVMSLRGNNRHFTRIVAPHELIPGHHLQGFMAQRHRPYRQLFSTPFFVEGWALYWEMLLWDAGYGRSPEDRVGMLFWRMHRCARINVSLRFHLGQMTPEEMIAFLVERVGHERLTATSEVRRYIAGDYSPLYQCAYMIGGLQLRALRGEAVGSGRLGEKAFHDDLLTHGAIPIELLREELFGRLVEPDWRASWRFDSAVAPASR